METSASFEARSAPLPYPTASCRPPSRLEWAWRWVRAITVRELCITPMAVGRWSSPIKTTRRLRSSRARKRTIPGMKRALGVIFASLLFCVFSFSTPGFAASLAAPRTLRLDYYHTGNSHSQWFSLDRVVLEPLEWPGNLNKSIDESQLGEYLFEVRERGSGKLVYSRGFNSVFGEWKTT